MTSFPGETTTDATTNIPHARRLSAPGTWRDTATHYLRALEDPWFRALVLLQDAITTATVDFWRREEVVTIHLPVTTGSISSPMGLGSDSLPVQVNLAGVDTYLADSMQFMLEYGCRLNEQGAYYVMPSFRGEDADESHLCQFFHSEAEIPGGLDDVIAVVERYLLSMTTSILDRYADLIEQAAGSLGHVDNQLLSGAPFQRITFEEAVRHLGNDPCYIETHDDASASWRTMTRAGERKLMQDLGEFLWVTHNDHLSVPFYQAYEDETKLTARNGDLLFGVGETVGCGERHRTAEETLAALHHHDVDPDDYTWYHTMKDARPMLTSGFGLGVERYLLWLFQHDDIRDMQILPRFNGVNVVP